MTHNTLQYQQHDEEMRNLNTRDTPGEDALTRPLAVHDS